MTVYGKKVEKKVEIKNEDISIIIFLINSILLLENS